MERINNPADWRIKTGHSHVLEKALTFNFFKKIKHRTFPSNSNKPRTTPDSKDLTPPSRLDHLNMVT